MFKENSRCERPESRGSACLCSLSFPPHWHKAGTPSASPGGRGLVVRGNSTQRCHAQQLGLAYPLGPLPAQCTCSSLWTRGFCATRTRIEPLLAGIVPSGSKLIHLPTVSPLHILTCSVPVLSLARCSLVELRALRVRRWTDIPGETH